MEERQQHVDDLLSTAVWQVDFSACHTYSNQLNVTRPSNPTSKSSKIPHVRFRRKPGRSGPAILVVIADPSRQPPPLFCASLA